ncbi:uncharacterized protein LOC113791296 [Dermatophagoides pteronyssinus]|uniref:Uncharacterized protein LOC113791296 n=2 Tax=Dermatophagoides pteronyssinus TaxID=6956 RepID=A0A6P6XV83_DERPT|nr:uncharacterized protein LOC113791296 [Dermatophagoides pteronyssinus]
MLIIMMIMKTIKIKFDNALMVILVTSLIMFIMILATYYSDYHHIRSLNIYPSSKQSIDQLLTIDQFVTALNPYVDYLKKLEQRLKQSSSSSYNDRQIIYQEIRQKQSEVELIKARIYNIIETIPYRSQQESIELNINLQNCRTFIRICEDFIRQYFTKQK